MKFTLDLEKVITAVVIAAALGAWNQYMQFRDFQIEVRHKWDLEEARIDAWKKARAFELGITKKELNENFFGKEQRLLKDAREEK